MENNLVVSIYNDFDLREVIITIPKTFMAIDLIEELIVYFSLPTTNYVYSLYLDEDNDNDFNLIGNYPTCFGYNNTCINDIDYIKENHYLHEYSINNFRLSLKLVREYKFIFNIKQLLRWCKLL